MANLLITLFFWILILPIHASAQPSGVLYAAPGMPVILPSRHPAASVSAAKPTPEVRPWLTPPLPRYWRIVDPQTRQQANRQMIQALYQRVRYPATALRYEQEGTVWVRVLIGPAGEPVEVQMLEKQAPKDSVSAKPAEVLRAETRRVALLLRFEPRSGPLDTVVFPLRYRIQ